MNGLLLKLNDLPNLRHLGLLMYDTQSNPIRVDEFERLGLPARDYIAWE